ncbi:MAG TPA: GIY-YIG nuclease family protein [Thermoplasmata archaeon]|nr:GIY-YIG nuclease family protein [Thermoplasmata archaeon]
MKGSYLLLIEVKEGKNIKIGKIGEIYFPKGYYIYVGSAMNNIEKRIARHIKKNKKMRWHIDYLIEKTDLIEIFYKECEVKEECSIAEKFLINGFSSIKKFGASDCKCKSHLFYTKNKGEFYKLAEKIGMKRM